MEAIQLFANLQTPTGLVTSDATAPDTGGTITIGDVVYTFRTALSSPAVPNEVLIGVSAAACLDNLKLAINAGSGAGTNYSTGTLVNSAVEATTNTDTTQLLVKRSTNVSRRDLRLEESATHITTNAVNGKFINGYLQEPGTINADFDLPGDAKGLIAILDISVEAGTATLDVKFQYRDPINNKYVDVPGAAFAQKSAVGTSQLSIYPGLTASANVAVTQALSKHLRCVAVEAGGSSSMTYTLTVLPLK